MNNHEDLVYRLRKRAEIRRQIPTRKSVQDNQPDRLSDLLEESAVEIERLHNLSDSACHTIGIYNELTCMV